MDKARSHPELQTMLRAGTYLGKIMLAWRGTIQLMHGPGGMLEGSPPDWEQAFLLACAYAGQYIERNENG